MELRATSAENHCSEQMCPHPLLTKNETTCLRVKAGFAALLHVYVRAKSRILPLMKLTAFSCYSSVALMLCFNYLQTFFDQHPSRKKDQAAMLSKVSTMGLHIDHFCALP